MRKEAILVCLLHKYLKHRAHYVREQAGPRGQEIVSCAHGATENCLSVNQSRQPLLLSWVENGVEMWPHGNVTKGIRTQISHSLKLSQKVLKRIL